MKNNRAHTDRERLEDAMFEAALEDISHSAPAAPAVPVRPPDPAHGYRSATDPGGSPGRDAAESAAASLARLLERLRSVRRGLGRP